MPKIKYQEENFNRDSLDKIDLINDILEEYANAGYEMTLRQAYYQMVARGYIPNTDRSYANLATLVNRGRMGGLIDWDHIVDTTRHLRGETHWNSPTQIIRAAYAGYNLDKWKDQEYRVEVWVEKDAAVSVVSGICNSLDIPYFSCRGYTGQAAMWGCAQRLRSYIENPENPQKPVILHLGDHDPSGIDMSRDIEERLNLFIEKDLENEAEQSDNYDLYNSFTGITFVRVALNMRQILQYSPPPNPAKITDSRAKGYIERYGDESWELDALRPQTVEEIITENVNDWLDSEKMEAIEKEELKDKDVLKKLVTQWSRVSKELLDG